MGYLLPRVALPAWLPSRTTAQVLAWGGIALGLLWRWSRHVSHAVLGPALASLGAVSLVGLALAGVQLLPSLEFSGTSDRAVEEQPLSVFDFSLEPYRLVELAWPNAFGTLAPENRSWLQSIPPSGQHELWSLSLYLGGLTVGLALGRSRRSQRRLGLILAELAGAGRGVRPRGELRPAWEPALVGALVRPRPGPFSALMTPAKPICASTRSSTTGLAVRMECWPQSCRGSRSSAIPASC